MIENCEVQAGYQAWTATEKNSCHIAVMNHEMGELRDAQLVMNTKFDFTLGILVVIGVAIIGVIVKKYLRT